MSAIFGYYINIDERGDFQADVRNEQGVTVYEVKAGDSLGEDETSIFVDGYMSSRDDVAGLGEYLKELEVIPASAELLSMQEFERRVEMRQVNQGAPLNGEVETLHFDEEAKSGFIIRPEDSDTDEYKAEEWREGDIVDHCYGSYKDSVSWVQAELAEHLEWRQIPQKAAVDDSPSP